MAFTLNATAEGSGGSCSVPSTGTPGLVVGLFAQDGATAVTGVTYGGVAMTALTQTTNGAQGAQIWYLVAGIPSGPKSLSWSGVVATHGCGASFDCATTAAFDTEAGASGTSAGPSVTFTPTAQPNVILAVCSHEGASIMTAKGSGQVGLEISSGDGFFDEGTWNTAFTYEATTSTASNNQTFTNAASDTWSMRVASFYEVSVARTETYVVMAAHRAP